MCGLSFVGHRASGVDVVTWMVPVLVSALRSPILFWLCSLFHSQTSYVLTSFILKNRRHNVLPLLQSPISCHLPRRRPNHVWFLPLSPGYMVQGCMHLHYCRDYLPFLTVPTPGTQMARKWCATASFNGPFHLNTSYQLLLICGEHSDPRMRLKQHQVSTTSGRTNESWGMERRRKQSLTD